MTQSHTDAEGREKIRQLIKDMHIALLVTHDGERLHARPMGAIGATLKSENWDGTLWFFTRADSPKIHEIERDHNILLSYSDPSKQNYVSLSGTAHIVRDADKIKELWSEPMRTWFPQGPDDPNIALIHVHTEAGEYWDSPNGLFVYAYGYLKARLTGHTAHPGENEKVSF